MIPVSGGLTTHPFICSIHKYMPNVLFIFNERLYVIYTCVLRLTELLYHGTLSHIIHIYLSVPVCHLLGAYTCTLLHIASSGSCHCCKFDCYVTPAIVQLLIYLDCMCYLIVFFIINMYCFVFYFIGLSHCVSK